MSSAAADPGRNADGTFKAGNTASSGTADVAPINSNPSEGMPASVDPSRNPDGTFKKGSQATNPDNFANRPTKEVQDLAKEGGEHSHDNDNKK